MRKINNIIKVFDGNIDGPNNTLTSVLPNINLIWITQ